MLKDALYVFETPPEGSWRTFSGWNWRDRETSIGEALKVPVAVCNEIIGSPDGEKKSAGGRPCEEYGARIDYIYVSDGVRVLDFKTVNDPRPGTKLYSSDHFPVVATVEL